MHFQSEFYLHVVGGHAGDAGPILAQLALQIGHDATAYPFPFHKLAMVGDFAREHGTQGLNEFYAIECARALVLREVRPWNADQSERLKAVARLPIPKTLSEKYPLS